MNMFFVSLSEKPLLVKTWFSDHLQMLDQPKGAKSPKENILVILQNIHTNTIALLNTSAVLLIWYSQIIFSWSVFIIWWVNFFGGNVSQRVNDGIESWFSWWGYIIACACCKLSCYNSSLALSIVAYSDTGNLKIPTTDFPFFSMGLLPDTQNCGCACAGNAGNVFPVTAGKRSRHASRHVRDARAVMHAGIVN